MRNASFIHSWCAGVTPSVLRSKAARLTAIQASKIKSSPPVQVSSTVAISGSGSVDSADSVGQGSSNVVQIEGSMIQPDDNPTGGESKTLLSTERLKGTRSYSEAGLKSGVGFVVSTFPVMKSHVAVSSSVNVVPSLASKVPWNLFYPHFNSSSLWSLNTICNSIIIIKTANNNKSKVKLKKLSISN